jgi:hypothetical protein
MTRQDMTIYPHHNIIQYNSPLLNIYTLRGTYFLRYADTFNASYLFCVSLFIPYSNLDI